MFRLAAVGEGSGTGRLKSVLQRAGDWVAVKFGCETGLENSARGVRRSALTETESGAASVCSL